METLFAVAHHKNHYYSGGYRKGNNNVDRCGPFPSRGFREVNCRGFEAGVGLLPTPFKGYCPYGGPVSNRGGLSQKPLCPGSSVSGKPRRPIAINFKGGKKGNVCFLERWAGPAYSNSPPPSSLPMPRFDVMKPKRTVSLELRKVDFESEFGLMMMGKGKDKCMYKSAPSSPTRDGVCSSDGFFSDDDSATKTLRRILNLDVGDD